MAQRCGQVGGRFIQAGVMSGQVGVMSGQVGGSFIQVGVMFGQAGEMNECINDERP